MATQTVTTTDHNVIRSWAEARNAQPARWKPAVSAQHPYDILIALNEKEAHLQVDKISWEEWFQVFERGQLCFTYTTDDPQDHYYQLGSREKPIDPQLQAPVVANQDKHINFRELEDPDNPRP